MTAGVAGGKRITRTGGTRTGSESWMFQGFPPAAPLLVLAAYSVAFGFLAKRFFKWE